MIAKEDVEKVNSRMDVVDIISRFIKLKKKGANYIGQCPFHNEKSGSFTVSPAKQIYKCFGCGKSGNAITFVMEHERSTYPDAVKWIGGVYNMEINDVYTNEAEREKANESDALYIINKFAAENFKDQLSRSAEGMKYMEDRGLTGLQAEAIHIFGLGYCGGSDELSKEIAEKHYSLEVAATAGLVKERNGTYRDIYFDRVIFPHHNLSGKVHAFGGRLLIKDDKRPKYVNSPENAIFHKGNALYGMYQARAAIVKADEALVVEGYMDVISMYINGIQNIVASNGTSLTENQIKLIRRFTKNITLLYDGDAAGLKAVIRAIELAIAEGMSIRIVQLPVGDDPDSFVRRERYENTAKYLSEKKMDIVDFYVSSQDLSTPEQKDAVVRELARLVNKIGEDSHFRKKHYSDKIMKVFQITPAVLHTYASSTGDLHAPQTVTEESGEVIKREPLIYGKERELTRLLLKYGEKQYYGNEFVMQAIINAVQEEKDDYYTPNNITTIIHRAYRAAMEDGEAVSVDTFTQSENAAVASFACSVSIEDTLFSEEWNDSMKSSNLDYKQEVRMALGLYQIAWCRMQLWMLHNKVDQTTDDWTPDIVTRVDQELRSQIRNTAKELGLSNFKF